jgi:DNA-binding MarR family transcriptional regulator
VHRDLVAAFNQVRDIHAQVGEAGQGAGDWFDLGFRSDAIGDPGMGRDQLAHVVPVSRDKRVLIVATNAIGITAAEHGTPPFVLDFGTEVWYEMQHATGRAPRQAPKRQARRSPPESPDAQPAAEVTWLRVSPSPAAFERDSPGAEALSTECAINLLHVRDLLWTRLDRLVRRHRIPSPAGFVILNILDGADAPLPPHVIADRMILTPGTMTGLIATLQKHGYVSTATTAGPGRRLLISMTDSGRRVLHHALRELDPEVVKWLICFDEAEKLSLLQLLGKLGTHLKTASDT